MKRNLIIATLVVFAWSSIFLLSSCAKKQVIAEEKEITAPPKEEEVKVEEKVPPAVEVAREVKEPEEEKELRKAEEARIEKVKELEVAREKVAEERVAEEKVAEERVAEERVIEEKPGEEKVIEAKVREEKVWEDRRGIRFEAESVYFDFDKSFIRPEYRPILAKKGEFLKDNPNIHIRIEGNCDERGTNEYNLALGERRSESARSFLVSLGISPDRIETISYGEERPLALGRNEDSWSQNRRDDFVIMKK